MPIINRIAEFHDEITEWRRDFHENPELLYDVHRTAGKVEELLKSFGCDEVVPGIGQTGVVGIIKGNSDKSGKVIGLRADMDALPIHEKTGKPYASKTPGKMHACGHDGHTAMLLGAAKYLAETRNFDGTVAVIFQPAEEGGAGGKAMVDDGMMDRWGIQEVFGMHNFPGIPVGEFAIREGGIMAAATCGTLKLLALIPTLPCHTNRLIRSLWPPTLSWRCKASSPATWTQCNQPWSPRLLLKAARPTTSSPWMLNWRAPCAPLIRCAAAGEITSHLDC